MRLALSYLVFGVVWILFSDAIGLRISRDPVYITTFQNYKGLFFVGLSALLILLLDRVETQRRAKAAQALAESEELFRATFDLAAIGMAHVSPQGHWLRVNQKFCEITGYKASELLSGMTFQEITHPDDLSSDLAQAQALLRGETDIYTIEKRYLGKNGEPIWVNLTASLVRHQNGAPRYFISAIEDISERRQTSEQLAALTATLDYRIWERTKQLAEANSELESFSYSVSHDLRAPLRAVSGFAQILQRRYSEALNAQGQHYLSNIVLASGRMNQLIDDLLRYARLGRQSVASQPIPLTTILETVRADLADKIEKTQARLEIDASLPILQGDETLLGQIFLNLFDNALKYHRPGVAPQIIVAAHRAAAPQENICIVQVADNGQGIPLAQQPKVFNVFQRLHSEEYPGTGIGLAIVTKAASLLGGTVMITSPLPADFAKKFDAVDLTNCGSLFTLRLPLSSQEGQPVTNEDTTD